MAFHPKLRATIATPGPLAIMGAVLLLCVIAALVLLFVLGALLIWIPVLVAVVAVLFLSGLVRGRFRRLR